MRDFKKFVYIAVTVSIIMIIGPILVSIIRPSLSTEQAIISEYTLAVTVVLAAAGVVSGGIFMLSFYLRREIEQQKEEMKRIVKEANQTKVTIENWYDELSANGINL